jgi:hypothetical protein
MRDVKLHCFCCSVSVIEDMAGDCSGIPERPFVGRWGSGDDNLRPWDLGGAVDEEILEQGGGEGHVAVCGAEKAGYGGLVFGAEACEEREGGVGTGGGG